MAGSLAAWFAPTAIVVILLAVFIARRTSRAIPALTPGDRTVVVTACGPRKIEIVKLVRAYTGLGVIDSKNFAENLPQKLVQNVSAEAAGAVAQRFASAGGAAEVVPDATPVTPSL